MPAMSRLRTILGSAALVLTVVMVVAVARTASAAEPAPLYIGTATMEADGTLVLWLRAESGAIVGHGTMTVRPGDPHYEDYKRHIGGIAPGETKPVPAWPDEEPAGRDADPAKDEQPKR